MSSILGGMDKAARRARREWTAAPSFVDELAADLKADAIRAESKRRPSTSVVPKRCAGCGEWSSGACRYCRLG
jgi:hypothetical protein